MVLVRCTCLASLVLLSVAARATIAQHVRPFTAPPEFALDQWTTEDGLPQNSVTSLAQTADGFLFVGTFGGLARFDGTTFRPIERVDSSGRHVDRVLSLVVGPAGALWIGTENGLLRYRDEAFEVYTTADGLPDNEIPALHVDRRGVLWIGTERGGIARMVEGRFETVRDVDGHSSDHVLSIHEDAAGTLWANVGSRFITIEDGVSSAARWRASPVRGVLHMALEDADGAHWFASTEGLARVADDGVRLFGRRDGVPGRAGMIEDPGGGYWLTTANDGLYFFRPDAAPIQRYALSDGRRQYRVRTALASTEGHVWFGTDANGLLRVRRKLFTTYTSAHGLSHDVATAVYGDEGGAMWVGTNCGGVNVIDPERRTVRTVKPRMSGDPAGDPCVFSMTEAPAGTMWIGTWGGGLTQVVGSREERLRDAGGLRDSVVLALFTDRDGTVWVGTNAGGLSSLERGRVRATYGTEDGLAHNSVRVIHQTRDGALWIGTLEGLSRFAEGRFATYTAVDGLSAEHVRSLHEDSDGTLWIGTYGGGLNRLRDGVFTAITTQHGLADDIVSSILEDDHGFFWMTGNRGIYRVARRELNRFAEGGLRRVHSVLYGAADGLPNPETNGGFQPAAWRDHRGRLWFPTVRGVAVVDPARVSVLERPPTVIVEEVVVNGVAHSPGQEIVAGPGRPNLEFRYAGLSLSTPELVTFRYRLEGYDEEWTEAGSRRVAYYPRLEAGQYRFVVTAANRDGLWNAGGDGVSLRVVAPPWSRWWFRLSVAAAIVGLLIAFARRRQRTARRKRTAQEAFSRRLIESLESERKRIAGELHDGLGQELLVVRNRALIGLASSDLRAGGREQLQHISDIVTKSLANVRGLAHNLTPYQLEHLGLTAAVRAMVEEASETSGMAFHVAIEDIDDACPVDGRINVYRIAQEAVSNIIKHSRAANASVLIRRIANTIELRIADDGCGFAADGSRQAASSFGLSGIAERARMLGGKLAITSAPGRGTRIALSMPSARPAASRPASSSPTGAA